MAEDSQLAEDPASPGRPPIAAHSVGRVTRCKSRSDPISVRCRTTAECTGQTGVEMGALSAVSVALLTIYDMCEAVDRGMTMGGVRLVEKRGGKSGDFVTPLSAPVAQ